MADGEDSSSSSDSGDITSSLSLPPPKAVPVPSASRSEEDDDGVSTIATDDIGCSLSLPPPAKTEVKKPILAGSDPLVVPNATPPQAKDDTPEMLPKVQDDIPKSVMSSLASQPAKISRECKIKSPKTPTHSNVKDRVASLPSFLAVKKPEDLGDSCSMLSTKTDPTGSSKRTNKKSDGSLPKSPKSKMPKSPSNSPSRSSKTKIKKAASHIISTTKKGSDNKEASRSKITDVAAFSRTLKKVGLSLPPVVLIGDTGAGKTSLVSSLCHISLPQQPTQCPLQIHMKQASDVKAEVSVEWKSHIVANQFPEYTTMTTANWDDIPEMIIAAQDFILEHCHKQLTNDTIVLELQGPTCNDVTVVDLPGTDADHDETLRSEIAQLHHEHLPQAVILTVHTARPDWQSSPVIADALAVDPEGQYTIHCLTKPDLLDTQDDILKLLSSSHREIQNIHAVKVGGVIGEDQQYYEAEQYMKKKNVLGVVTLREQVVALQIDLFREGLPSIKQKTREKRESVALQLGQMGRPCVTDSERRSFYEHISNAVVNEVEASLSGKGKLKGQSAASRLHEDCSSFRDRILEGTLATVQTVKEGSLVLVSGRHDVVRGEVVHIDIDKGFACVDYTDDNGKRCKTLFDRVDMKAPEDIEENDVWAAGNRIFIGRANNMYDALRKIPLATIRTDPSWLKQRMANDATEDLPCFLNSESFKGVIVDCIEEDWKPQALRLLDLVRVSVSETISQAIRSHDGKRHKDLLTLLAKRSELALQEILSSAHKQIQAHLEEEKHPLTQDTAFYTELSTRKHNALKQRLLAAIKLSEDRLDEFAAVKGIFDDVFTKHCSRSGGDMLADEMESLLSSYGSFAAKRVLDRTPQICWRVLRTVPSSLSAAFEEISDKALHDCFTGEQRLISKQKELSDAIEQMNETLDMYQRLS